MSLRAMEHSLIASLTLVFSLAPNIASSSSQPVLLHDEQSVSQQPKPRAWNRRHAEGWYWREVPPEKIEPEDPEETTPALIDPLKLYPDINQPLADPLQTLEALQQAVETAKARAVLQPTDENVLHWIEIHNQLLVKNSVFADRYQRAIWRNPQYDFNQVRPSNPVALSAYSDAYDQDRRQAMRDIAQEYGLYFFVRESCAYCHAMAPYLKRFADAYDFTVISVTIDGGSVLEYPEPMYNPGFAEKLGVEQTPAIILAKPSEGIIEPIAYGFINTEELETRIYRLFRLEPGHPTYQVPNS